MERENRKEVRKRKALRILLITMTLCAAVFLLGDLAVWLISVMGGISFSVNRAGSIGIIGGADGPTSIIIASAAAPIWHMILEFLVLIIGILGLRQFKRK